MLVKEVMTPFAETIGSGESVEAAARKMKGLGIGALAVCEREVVVGIVTDRDIVVRSVAAGEDPVLTSVREAMTPLVISCSADDEESSKRRASWRTGPCAGSSSSTTQGGRWGW